MKKLGFGLMRLPLLDANVQESIDVEQFKKMVDIFMERGFTYFDTAYMYHKGKSEVAFNEAVVKRYPRESYTITDKMPMMYITSKEMLQTTFDEQMARLGVDYVDYYWLHSLNNNTYQRVQEFKAFEFIADLKKQGKVKHIGFSFHDSAEVLDKILTDHPEVEFVQLQLNYVDWDSERVQSGKCYDVCVKHNKPVIVMEPVKGGSLVKTLPEKVKDLFKENNPDLSVASWAIRWVASLPNVYMVLSGMSNLEQLEDNTSYMKEFVPLTDKEQEVIKQAQEIVKKSYEIPCTACRYCTTDCPMNIAIPDYFALYNKYMAYKTIDFKNAKEEYQKIAKDFGKCSDCIGCGQCEDKCPQHLKIRALLREAKHELE